MADTGFKAVTSGSVLTIGGSSSGWTNPANIVASDNNRATSSASLTNGKFTDYLVGSFAAGTFSAVPPDATINGFEVQIERSASSAGRIQDSEVRITNSANKADTVTSYGTADATILYPSSGGPTDMWSLGSILPSQLDGLQLRLSCKSNTVLAATPKIDFMSLKVYYTPSTGNIFSIAGAGTASLAGAATAQGKLSGAGAAASSLTGASKSAGVLAASGAGTPSLAGSIAASQGSFSIAGTCGGSLKGAAKAQGTWTCAGAAASALAGSPAAIPGNGVLSVHASASAGLAGSFFRIWTDQNFNPEEMLSVVTFSDGAFFSDGADFGQDFAFVWTPQNPVNDPWIAQAAESPIWADQ